MHTSVFVNGTSPWAGLGEAAAPFRPPVHLHQKPQKKAPPMRAKAKTSGPRVDPANITIADDPLPTARLVINKYWPTFAKLKVGQNLRCQPEDVQCISSALRKYIEVHNVTDKGKPVRVITQKTSLDGLGRVWLTQGEPASKQKAAA